MSSKDDDNRACLVVDPTARTNFTMIPNMVIDNARISHHAFRLYVWYKRICWETGQCYKSLSSIGEACAMRRQAVIDAREELREAGLITIDRDTAPDGSTRITVTIVDIWQQNKGPVGAPDGSGPEIGPVRKCDPDPVRSGDPKKTPGRNTPSAGLLTQPASPDFADKAVAALIEGLADKRKIMRRPQPRAWARELRKFIKEGEIDKPRLKEVLQWYVKHIGEDYVPAAYSAKTFCEKYPQIEDAMVRATRQAQPGTAAAPGGNPKLERQRLAQRVLYKCWELHPDIGLYDVIFQETIDEALVAMGLQPGEFKWRHLAEVGNADL